MHKARHYSAFDKICISFDQAIKTLTHDITTTGANYPAEETLVNTLSKDEMRLSAGLMRVNHTGEVCAQALYHGQASVTTNPDLKKELENAALEEGDHLYWCKRRLDELDSHTSYLNPLWYMGSFCIGVAAGMIGDDWSLGFVVETERQVIKHLEEHARHLVNYDERSTVILKQMESDEAKHRDAAHTLGARELPTPIKWVMRGLSRIMVKTAYYV